MKSKTTTVAFIANPKHVKVQYKNTTHKIANIKSKWFAYLKRKSKEELVAFIIFFKYCSSVLMCIYTTIRESTMFFYLECKTTPYIFTLAPIKEHRSYITLLVRYVSIYSFVEINIILSSLPLAMNSIHVKQRLTHDVYVRVTHASNIRELFYLQYSQSLSQWPTSCSDTEGRR